MTNDVGIDVPLSERRITQLLDACDLIRGHEFVLSDARLLGLAVTAVFDRAVHDFAWTTVQVVTGTSSELLADADAVASTVSSLGELDDDIAGRLGTVRGELDLAAS